jgi:hypothetical protein
MGGYLEGYGVKEARRGRMVKWTALAVLLVVVAGSLTYLAFRSYPANKKVELFLADLRKRDYQSAYRLWGCTESSPCREYSLEKFLEDWGPKSAHPDASAAKIKKAGYCGPGLGFKLANSVAQALGEKGCYCGPGVNITVEFGPGDEVPLRYERKDGTLGFAPWPICVPQPRGFQ